jgi:hypothetical protein
VLSAVAFALSQRAYNVTVSGKDRHTAGLCSGSAWLWCYLQSVIYEVKNHLLLYV